MKKSVVVSFCGISTALSVVFLYLGSIIWLFAYVAPILAGFLVQTVNRCFGIKPSLLVYFTTSIISVFILPDKETALLFAMFFGYYPIARLYLDKIKKALLRVLSKLFVFNISVIAVELICVYIFMIPLDNSLGKIGLFILLLLANVVFVLYDRLFLLYNILWDKKLKKILNNIIKY